MFIAIALKFCWQGSEDTIHRQLRFLFNIEVYWIAKMKRLDKEMADAARKAAEEALAEGDITVMPDEEEFIVFKGERILLKRLKILMVYHSITTVILYFNFLMITKCSLRLPITNHLPSLLS